MSHMIHQTQFHIVTALSAQVRSPDRVNVSIDGAYRFSLDVTQVTDLNVRVGRQLTAAELAALETESQFGKLYTRALEYCLSRPHSRREIIDYLRRQTLARRYKSRRTGAMKEAPGVSQAVAGRVLARLTKKGYIDDESFARWWVETRHLVKGASRRKLSSELAAKGVSREIIEGVVMDSARDDSSELAKLLAKKRARYPDQQKLIAYLMRQGFSYDDIKAALALPPVESDAAQ